MISKEQLARLIQLHKETDEFIDRVSELGIDFIDTPLFNAYGCLLDMVLDTNFSEEDADMINWWIFESDCGENDLTAYDCNGNPICKTFDDLWDYVSKNKE